MAIQRLRDRIIVITGATGGIGFEIARIAAANGAVPILTARSASKLEEAAGRLPTPCGTYVLDVTDAEQTAEVMQAIISEYGRIDVLINNAGYGEFALFRDTRPDQFRAMMEVNYFGLVNATQAVLPHMLARRSGHIVNIASMAGKIGSPKSSAYSATKHAVLGLTNCLRQELAGTGVAVTAVNPGPVDTAFFDRADPSGNYKKNVGFFMLSPTRVAQEALDLILTRKAEKDLPFTAALGVKLYQLFPRLLDRVYTRVIDRK